MRISKHQVALGLWIIGILPFATLPGHAQNTPTVEGPDLCQQLRSPDMSKRVTAALAVMGQLRQAEKCLVGELDDLRQKPVAELRKFDGPFHVTVRLLAGFRSSEALGRLLPLIDFQLDPATAGAGTNNTGISAYPVAWMILDIGRGQLSGALFDRLRQPASDTTLRIITWLLQQELRREGVSTKVQQRLDKHAEYLKANPNAVHLKDEIANLKRVQELLSSKEPLIIVDPSLKYAPPKAPEQAVPNQAK